EGNSGTTTFTFTVTLSNPISSSVTVHAASANGTATTADGDYVALPDTLVTFTPGGSLTQTVSVTVNGDTKFEADHAFNVNLSSASGASISDSQGVGTIQNDDAKPTISISPSNVSHAEGNSGPTGFVYSVALSNASDEVVSV